MTKTAHYGDDSDEPTWIGEDATLPSAVTRYVEGVDGDLAVTTSSTGSRVLQLLDLHGDVAATVPLADGAGAVDASGRVLNRTDEFGNPEPLAGAATANAPNRYGWLGGAQRSSESLGDLVLMGVRLYAPATGRFLTPDPVPGGSASGYDYCNADPVNCTDLGGTIAWGKVLGAVAQVAEIASFIPGPVGAAAAGISAVAYAVTGNTGKAVEMGVTAAAALVGAGAVVKVAARAVGAARAGGKIAARAAPKALRTVGVKLGGALRACNSFVPGTLVLMADGSSLPIEQVVAGDEVLSVDPETGQQGAETVLNPIVGYGAKHLVLIQAGEASWTATDHHPILTEDGWTDAIDLRVGDQITDAHGQQVPLTDVTDMGIVDQQLVYNLHVTDHHTYLLVDHDTQLLAHNASCNTGVILRERGVTVRINSRDHAPWHAHVIGGGPSTKIGPALKPINNGAELSRLQREVLEANRSVVRKAINRYIRHMQRGY